MNEDFKRYAKQKRVKLYEVAERLGIQPCTFSVQYMRHELSKPDEKNLRAIVDEIARKREA